MCMRESYYQRLNTFSFRSSQFKLSVRVHHFLLGFLLSDLLVLQQDSRIGF